MEKQDSQEIKISVRNLVEFILRSGDIDTTGNGINNIEAMQEGSRIHRKIQKSMGEHYQSEVALSLSVPISREELTLQLCVEGRADGIIFHEKEGVTVDEIKGIYGELATLKEPIPVHRAQVMCYAYMYSKKNALEQIGIRLSYCNIETEAMKYFEESLLFSDLEKWFQALIQEYGKWAIWQYQWQQERNQSIKMLQFPFPYRNGQKELVSGVYRTILREKKLFIEAPTGVGKTITTIFPAIKAMGEGIVCKLFYLTAKTITRTVAEDTFHILEEHGAKIKIVTITAKEKSCILEKQDCNPQVCERAKGHYNRINEAVFDILTNESTIGRENIQSYAKKHRVCPFEMCLDLTLWADGIICDYNYAFDPRVYLRRFFVNEKKNDYVFLIDEAHNLVERAREMYSASLYKEDFLEVKKWIKGKNRKLEALLEACNRDLLQLKRECEELEVVEDISKFVLHLMKLLPEYEEFLHQFPVFEGRDTALNLYFEIYHFLNQYENLNEAYLVYTKQDEAKFQIKIQCMNPAGNLKQCLERGRSAVFFSATFLPIQYYKEQLGGTQDDYAVYAVSPFDKKNQLILIGMDVSSRYTRRNTIEYQKILDYIRKFTKAKLGNYLVFFPSYQMMEQVLAVSEGKLEFAEVDVQKNIMSEKEREEFLKAFEEEPRKTRIGFCVMGGIFSEGIDLKSSRLIGAIVIGTGLPMVCKERELFREYYEKEKGAGFDYAYLFCGMNKVLQSAGRVIRTAEDRGVILLLDERFCSRQYQELFPREWFPNTLVNSGNIQKILEDFWKERDNHEK